MHLADGLRKAALGSVEKTAASLFGWYEGQEKYQDLAKKLLDAAFLHGKTEPMSKTQNGFTDRRWSTVSAGWRNFRRAPMHIF